MVDHGKGSLDNAGKVLVAAWERRAGLDSTISYVARIRKTHPVAEAVKVGDIDTVSVSALAEKIECSVCGEDMRHCPHHIGQTYEYDGEDVLATALGRGLEFRELSITPFPADPRASAWVKNDSMFSAIEMLVESSEYKTQPQKVGVTTKMSEDKSEELALAEENRKLQAEKEQLQKKTEEAQKIVEQFQKREKAALVDRAFELEVEANLSRSEDEKVRKTELSAMSSEVLGAKIEDLKKFKEKFEVLKEKAEPKSKAVVAEVSEAEEKEEKKPPLTYAREEVKSGLRFVLGNMRTSEKARVITRQMALDSQNPNSSEYRAILKTNMKKLLGRSK
jgi:septum formation inhibitor MinC